MSIKCFCKAHFKRLFFLVALINNNKSLNFIAIGSKKISVLIKFGTHMHEQQNNNFISIRRTGQIQTVMNLINENIQNNKIGAM